MGKLSNELEFTCHKCGAHELELVVTNATVYVPIDAVWDTDDAAAGFSNSMYYDDGEEDRFICANCGTTVPIKHKIGDLVEDLKEYIRKESENEDKENTRNTDGVKAR